MQFYLKSTVYVFGFSNLTLVFSNTVAWLLNLLVPREKVCAMPV